MEKKRLEPPEKCPDCCKKDIQESFKLAWCLWCGWTMTLFEGPFAIRSHGHRK